MSSPDRPVTRTNDQVPDKKQTVLGLYVTSQEAYEMWKSDPDASSIIDVRIPEEYIFVGHAPMSRNIPLLFIKYQWDAEKDEPAITPNPAFVSRAKELFAPGDTLLVTCRSGGRSAVAVNALAQAGFTNVYNIIDGFEGDMVDDPTSAYHGKRMKNGWKNSGSPWTYECDTDLLWIEEA
jgi:rhodanese-related sulfurtransferase